VKVVRLRHRNEEVQRPAAAGRGHAQARFSLHRGHLALGEVDKPKQLLGAVHFPARTEVDPLGAAEREGKEECGPPAVSPLQTGAYQGRRRLHYLHSVALGLYAFRLWDSMS